MDGAECAKERALRGRVMDVVVDQIIKYVAEHNTRQQGQSNVKRQYGCEKLQVRQREREREREREEILNAYSSIQKYEFAELYKLK